MSRSCAKPRIELSGVRSSWLMRDRNSLLARLARSASSRAVRNAISAARRSVMSRVIFENPRNAPLLSYCAVITTLAQKRLPFLRMRHASSM